MKRDRGVVSGRRNSCLFLTKFPSSLTVKFVKRLGTTRNYVIAGVLAVPPDHPERNDRVRGLTTLQCTCTAHIPLSGQCTTTTLQRYRYARPGTGHSTADFDLRRSAAAGPRTPGPSTEAGRAHAGSSAVQGRRCEITELLRRSPYALRSGRVPLSRACRHSAAGGSLSVRDRHTPPGRALQRHAHRVCQVSSVVAVQAWT